MLLIVEIPVQLFKSYVLQDKLIQTKKLSLFDSMLYW